MAVSASRQRSRPECDLRSLDHRPGERGLDPLPVSGEHHSQGEVEQGGHRFSGSESHWLARCPWKLDDHRAVEQRADGADEDHEVAEPHGAPRPPVHDRREGVCQLHVQPRVGQTAHVVHRQPAFRQLVQPRHYGPSHRLLRGDLDREPDRGQRSPLHLLRQSHSHSIDRVEPGLRVADRDGDCRRPVCRAWSRA
jgi:hypothetical protein